MRRSLLVLAVLACILGVEGGQALGKAPAGKPRAHAGVSMTVFASGFNNPRGLKFGPDGNLYVAEGGLGGSHSTVGDCTQASGAAAPYTGSTHSKTLGSRISRVTPSGHVSTVVDSLPSSQTSAALGSLVSGISAVACAHHNLYGLLAGAGCSHGVPGMPNGVFRVRDDGTIKMIANLSRFQRNHPVANPPVEDFEPDGTWYSMASLDGKLYPMDSNHGELDRVTRKGHISRVSDISAKLGHNVPTALAFRAGTWKIGNLGVFGPPDGTTLNEKVWRLNSSGSFAVRGPGLEQVVSLAFRKDKLFALELSNTPGGPTPGTGQIVRVRADGPGRVIASGLMFPTGMTVGPDGAFYVSVNGLGFGAGQGQVLRITTG